MQVNKTILMFFRYTANKKNKPVQVRFKKWKIVKGDTVILISGKDKGKTGTVLKTNHKTN